jgi:hypothetical protein
MVSSGDTKACGKVIDYGPDQSLSLNLGRQKSIDSDQGGQSKTEDMLPVQKLVKVGNGNLFGEEGRELLMKERIPPGLGARGRDGEGRGERGSHG